MQNGVPSLAYLSLPPASYLRLLPRSSAPRRYLHLCVDREGGRREGEEERGVGKRTVSLIVVFGL